MGTTGCAFCFTVFRIIPIKTYRYKKVLPPDRKRRTACGVANTPSPRGCTPGWVPVLSGEDSLSCQGYTPGRTMTGQGGLPCGQTNKLKTLPSRRTTYAGGNTSTNLLLSVHLGSISLIATNPIFSV